MKPAFETPSAITASDGTLRPMLVLALPVLAEESLTMLVGYTDWWLAGHFLHTTEHKAAMGLMAYVLWLLPSFFSGIAIGATALVARLTGGGRTRSASEVVGQALLIGGLAASVVTAAAARYGASFVGLMQLQDEAAALTLQYLDIVVWSVPFIMLEQVCAACLRAAGDTVSGFVAKSIVNVVNLGLSTALIIGPGAIPQMGWRGLAVGTACGHIMGGAILLVLVWRGRAGLRLAPRTLRPNFNVWRRLLRIGIPGGIDVLAVLSCHFVYVAIINRLGTLEAAAHGLGVEIEAMAYLPGAAFSVAATTMVGQFLGAGDARRAARAADTTCAVGCAVMTGSALVFYFGGHALTTFFTGDPQDDVGLLTARLLKIVAFSTPPLAVLQILTGALRGAGDTRYPLLITFVGLLGIRIPLACLLAWSVVRLPGTSWEVAGMGWGIRGAWYAMVMDVCVRATLVYLRFRRGRWKSVKVC